MIYRVKNWNDHFENHKSRTIEECSFVCVPNKHHGLGFSRIMAEQDGAAIYGVWILILGICSRHRRPRGGWLTHDGHREGTALTPEDLSLQFRRPSNEIARALECLSSSKVDWVEAFQTVDDVPVDASALEVPPKCPSGALEQKRTEENRTLSAHAEAVYAEYPRKVAKPDAIKAIIKAFTVSPFETLLDQTKLFAKAVAGREQRYIPHPATWFNQQRFNDDPTTWRQDGSIGRSKENQSRLPIFQ